MAMERRKSNVDPNDRTTSAFPMRFIFPLVLFCFLGIRTEAATINAASPARADVSNAVNSASNGDTINIPPGNATWTSPLLVTKWLIFQGQGTNQTVITMNVPNSGGQYENGGLVLQGNGYNQVTGITFDGASNTANPCLAILAGQACRVHHCKFNKGGKGLVVAGPFGVVDHNEFTDCILSVRVNGLGNTGAQNWTLYYPIAFASTNYLFIEDNVFNQFTYAAPWSGSIAFVSSGQGSSYVVRKNSFNQNYNTADPAFDWHGDGGDGTAGNLSSQVYQNTFTLNWVDHAHSCQIGKFCDARGGQGLVYSNSITTINGAGPGIGVRVREEYPAGTPVSGLGTVVQQVTNQWQWANTVIGGSFPSTGCDEGCSTPGLDYHNGTYPGSYVQPYPHPLVGGAPPPPVPGSIRIIYASGGISEDQGSFTVVLLREGGTDGSVSVNYGTTNGTALAGVNYQFTSGSVTWAAGSSANKSVDVPIYNTGFNGTKTFSFGISGPTGGATLGSITNDVITITGVGGPPPATDKVRFQNPTSSVAVSGILSIPVLRTNATTGAVSVDYFTRAGTAQPGIDYTSVSGTLTFGAGITNGVLTVPISYQFPTTNRQFQLVLANVQPGSLIDPGTNTITIVGTGSPPPSNSKFTLLSQPGTNAALTLSPADVNGIYSGTTPFTATYTNNQTVTVTAIPTVGLYQFLKWRVDGIDAGTNLSQTVDVTSDRVVSALYAIPAGSPIKATVILQNVTLQNATIGPTPEMRSTQGPAAGVQSQPTKPSTPSEEFAKPQAFIPPGLLEMPMPGPGTPPPTPELFAAPPPMQYTQYTTNKPGQAFTQPATYSVPGTDVGISTPGLISTTNTVNGALNVHAFGAKGDGSTDDTDAIRAALAAASTLHKGHVLFPQGVYRTTGNIVLPAGITLSGASADRDGSTLLLTSTNTALLVVGGDTPNVSIERLTLGSLSTNATTGILFDGVSGHSTYGYDIGRCTIYGFQEGIRFGKSDINWQCDHGAIHDSVIVENTIGIHIDTFNVAYLTIRGIQFNTQAGGTAIWVERSGFLTIESCASSSGALVPSDFIHLGIINETVIMNCQAEGANGNCLIFDGPARFDTTLTLIGNTFNQPVVMASSILMASIGNAYSYGVTLTNLGADMKISSTMDTFSGTNGWNKGFPGPDNVRIVESTDIYGTHWDYGSQAWPSAGFGSDMTLGGSGWWRYNTNGVAWVVSSQGRSPLIIDGSSGDVLIGNGTNNIGMTISTTSNTSNDYAALKFKQAGAPSGALFAHTNDLYLVGNLVGNGDLWLEAPNGTIRTESSQPVYIHGSQIVTQTNYANAFVAALSMTLNGSTITSWPSGSGGGATNLTPWTSDINGNGNSLTNANNVRANNAISSSSAVITNNLNAGTETVAGALAAGNTTLASLVVTNISNLNGGVVAPTVSASTSMTLNGSTITSWPSGGGGVAGTMVTNSTGAAGDIVAFAGAGATNAAKATAANMTNAIGTAFDSRYNRIGTATNFDNITVTNTSTLLGAVNANNRITISNSSEAIRVVGSGTSGNASAGYLTFYDSNGSTRRGYLGDAFATDSGLAWVAETGPVNIYDSSGKGLNLTGGNANLGGGLTVNGSDVPSNGELFLNGGAAGSIIGPAIRILGNRFVTFLDHGNGYGAAAFLWHDTNDVFHIDNAASSAIGIGIDTNGYIMFNGLAPNAANAVTITPTGSLYTPNSVGAGNVIATNSITLNGQTTVGGVVTQFMTVPVFMTATPGTGTPAYTVTSTPDTKLQFGTNYVAQWPFLMPGNYNSNLVFKSMWNMETATSSSVPITAKIWKMTGGASASMGTENFSTANTVTTTSPGTARWPFAVNITITNTGGLAAGDWFELQVTTAQPAGAGFVNYAGGNLEYNTK